ncbi:MAG: PDZ domain-containing protein [Planctomycetia bacterium]|nr:PDZ domain-containing protein [Planctomycetia bacterium]
MPVRSTLLAAICFFGAANAPGISHAAEDLSLREEAAFRAAAAQVSPSVVAIETVGGLDTLGELLVGTGPTGGLVVSDDGYIISSTFNFAHKPASIIVSLNDGRRAPAKLVARDEVRKLVLLKIDAQKLPVAQTAPESDIAVGIWSIALGRAFEPEKPNVSVGIISAVNRIWGKAIQTDAKISPANYGGPLVDIRGRVLGVLVPLSPNEKEDQSGVEWYDSGIGFAVPMAHIERILPRLKKGEDLKTGLIGVSFRGKNVYADPPIIARARANSPAYLAGLRKGDRIRAVEGKPVDLQVQVMEAIQSRYAGDKLRVSIARGPDGKETFDRELPLVDHLDPYKRPFLGLLAERSSPAANEGKVVVRYVYEDSPAALKGIKVGDVVQAINGAAIKDRDALRLAVAESEAGKPLKLELQRAGEKVQVELEAAPQPETVPAKLPQAAGEPAAGDDGAEPKGVSVKFAEHKNECKLYVPETYSEKHPHGLVLLLHPEGGFQDAELAALVKQWMPHCRRDGLMLLVPSAAGEEGKWAAADLEFIGKVIDRVAEGYAVDPGRVVAHGVEEGSLVALRTAAQFPERIRAAAVVNSPSLAAPIEEDPAHSIAYYVATVSDFQAKTRIVAGIELLRKQFLPVTVRELPPQANYLDAEQLSELVRWIDTLDRI